MTTTQNNLTDNYLPDNILLEPGHPLNRPNLNPEEDGQPRLVNTTLPSNLSVTRSGNGANDDYYDVSNFYFDSNYGYGYYLPVLNNDEYGYRYNYDYITTTAGGNIQLYYDNASGRLGLKYTPPVGFSGQDSFTYYATDDDYSDFDSANG